MILYCNQQELKQAVGIVTGVICFAQFVVETKPICVMANEREVIIAGGNRDFQVEVNIPAYIKETGKFELSYQVLNNLIKSLDKGEVLIKSINETKVQISCGKYLGEIITNKNNSYEIIPCIENGTKLSVTSDRFKSIAQGSVFGSYYTPKLTCELLEARDGMIIVVGTNGSIFSRIYCNLKKWENVNFLITGKILRYIGKLIDGDGYEILITVGSEQHDSEILFEFKNIKILSKALSVKYPDFKHGFDEERINEIIVNREILISCIRRSLSILKRPDNVHTKITYVDDMFQAFTESDEDKDYENIHVELKAKDGKMEVIAKSNEGESLETLNDIQVTGEPFRVKLRCSNLMKALQELDGEYIEMGILWHKCLCAFKNLKNDYYMYLLGLSRIID